jgi:hypothetical protein
MEEKAKVLKKALDDLKDTTSKKDKLEVEK